jgi:hypothetical protein
VGVKSPLLGRGDLGVRFRRDLGVRFRRDLGVRFRGDLGVRLEKGFRREVFSLLLTTDDCKLSAIV